MYESQVKLNEEPLVIVQEAIYARMAKFANAQTRDGLTESQLIDAIQTAPLSSLGIRNLRFVAEHPEIQKFIPNKLYQALVKRAEEVKD